MKIITYLSILNLFLMSCSGTLIINKFNYPEKACENVSYIYYDENNLISAHLNVKKREAYIKVNINDWCGLGRDTLFDTLNARFNKNKTVKYYRGNLAIITYIDSTIAKCELIDTLNGAQMKFKMHKFIDFL